MGRYLDTINQTKIRPELLVEVLQMHAAMPPETRGVFEARIVRVFELLKRKGLGGRKIASVATAIDFRLTALARLDLDGALRGWSVPRHEPGFASISMDALKAAADEPLIEDDERQAAFDAERFRRRILSKR